MEENEAKYSIAIITDDAGTDYVNVLKDQLFKKIGWYHSRNSKAHITISEFATNEDELQRIVKHLKEIAGHENPIHLNFDGVDSYPNGAVFLAPDDTSKSPFIDMMKRIQSNLKITKSYNSKDPHLTIARKLNDENVEIALKMFGNVKLDFNCANVVLRKFNPEIKQYEIFSTDFPFLGLPPKPVAQTSLF
ncbi:MAG: 2'-5' RNA ligase family protein [Pedobacter sp.]|nr:MAG: 2'-5' RNA ligase family protein [Pedobacter sp.]